MSFNGNESEVITLQEGIDWTTNYRNANPNETKAHFFGKEKLQDILDQADCVGIRMYYAIDDNGAKQLVLVGASADEEDLYNGVLLDRAKPCPNYCSNSSPLNS